MKQFYVINLGCKVNAYEAEAACEAMEKAGWLRCSREEEADAVILYTCAVTNQAAAKSRKALHHARRVNPNVITAAAGCYAQIDDGMLEDADILVGTANKNQIPFYIDQFLHTHQKIRDIQNLNALAFEAMNVERLEDHSRGVLKIQDGCNQFCSYCIIPYARGRERSLAPQKVIEEARHISVHYSEIVLTGIHTGRYGREYGVSLAQLVREILAETPRLQRLRISSIEISEINDDLIDLMAEEPRIARHLHIPLQSGSDSVLRAMRRPYDTSAYYAKIEEIRRKIPDVAISCDIMTGFPGEGEREFEESFRFLEKCRFSFLHVFPFSLRKGTAAEKMPCQVPSDIKKERAARCIALSKKLSDSYGENQVGRDVDMIAEKPGDGITPGYTSQYVRCFTRDPGIVRGSMYHGRAVKWENGMLEIESAEK